MPSLLRPRNLYVALTYLLLSSMPFAQGLFGRPVEHAGQMLGLEVLCWTGAWGLFKRPAWFHWMLLPAFVALPVELYLQVFYGQGISTHHLGIIAETSPVEAMEFLGRKVWLLLATAIGVLAWFVTSWVAASRTRDLDWTDISRWVVLAVLGLGAGVFAYGIEFGVAAPVLPSAPSATAAHPHPHPHRQPPAKTRSRPAPEASRAAAPCRRSSTGRACRSTWTRSPTPGRSA
jgi:glucan phosphoethanolaminetransferase (alkaline phosphatase superfamily)